MAIVLRFPKKERKKERKKWLIPAVNIAGCLQKKGRPSNRNFITEAQFLHYAAPKKDQ